MLELDDIALLHEFVGRDSEAAFAALVRRHLNKVYSVALRHTGNPHEAEEITQAVFVILAKKARGLGKNVILSGWLYQTARLTAVTFIRGEIRRARREQEAHMQTGLNENEPEVWPQIAPLLDAAMAALNETDRHAVVLRFFDGKSLREVAAALGANEDAARKRVNRAVEKLQKFFLKRGVTSTTTTLAAAISVNSVQTAPAALTKAATAMAMAKGAAASSSTLTLIKGALKVMAWTKAKTAIVVGAGLLLAVGGTATLTFTAIKTGARRPDGWRVANFGAWNVDQAPPEVRILPTKFPATAFINDDYYQGRLSYDDSGQKMGGVGVSLSHILMLAYNIDPTYIVFATEAPPERYDFIASLPGEKQNTAALQTEIRNQFGLAGRLEQREMDVLLLKVKQPNAPGLKPGTRGHNNLRFSSGHYVSDNRDIHSFGRSLEDYFGIPVLDQTGLRLKYDFELKWPESDSEHPNPDGLKQVMLDQLGLELVPARKSLNVLVVEKAN